MGINPPPASKPLGSISPECRPQYASRDTAETRRIQVKGANQEERGLIQAYVVRVRWCEGC